MGISMGMGMGWDGYGDLMNHRHGGWRFSNGCEIKRKRLNVA